MFSVLLQGKGWRAALATAAASAALIVTGCSQQPSQASSGSPGGAIQASDTGRAQEPSESRMSMAFPTGNRNSSDLLVEQIGPRQVRVGQPYNYQVRVTNLTDQTLTGVVLRQHVPENFKMAQAEGQAQADAPREGDRRDWTRTNIGDLGPKQSKTIEMSGTPSQPGTLDTCLSAQYNPPMLCSHIAVVAPALRATAEGPSQVDVCQDIVYRYTITNTGTGTAHNVVLQENLPEGLQTADGQRTISMNVGDLTQGQTKDVTARLRAAQAGRYNTQAIVRSDAGEVQTQQVATAVLAPRLAITMTGPRETYLGQPLAYQVTVTNRGDAAAAQTRLRLGATPGRVQFVNAQGADGGQLASEQQGGGQDLGTIAPGQERTVRVNFNTQTGGPLSVEATVQAQCAQPVSTSVDTNVATVTAAALIVTHDPDPVPVGTNVTYHLILENKGTATDHDLRVTATLPDSLQFVQARGQTQGANNGQQITFGPVESLEPKQRVTWDVTAKALRPAEAEFQATMTSQSTPRAAAKIEPTKLIGGATGNETRTNEAPPTPRTNQPAPPPPGAGQ